MLALGATVYLDRTLPTLDRKLEGRIDQFNLVMIRTTKKRKNKTRIQRPNIRMSLNWRLWLQLQWILLGIKRQTNINAVRQMVRSRRGTLQPATRQGPDFRWWVSVPISTSLALKSLLSTTRCRRQPLQYQNNCPVYKSKNRYSRAASRQEPTALEWRLIALVNCQWMAINHPAGRWAQGAVQEALNNSIPDLKT